MAESNTQVTFLLDPSYFNMSQREEWLQLIASLLASDLPPTVDNYDSDVSKDHFQWGHKFSLKNNKFSRHEKCEAVSFNSRTLEQLGRDLSASSDPTTPMEFGMKSILDNLTVMLHDFVWDRLQLLSPDKKSLRARAHIVKGSNSHGYVDSDGQQSICQSVFNDDFKQKRPTNIICIVGPIPKNIQGQMRELQSKQDPKQPVKSFLTNHIFNHLTKLNVKMYWVNTSQEKPHTSDMALVFNTLSTFHGCVLPISLFQQQFLQRCEKCHRVTTVPNQDLQHRSLDFNIVNHSPVFPISYVVKSGQKLGRTKQSKQKAAVKCSFVLDDDNNILENGTVEVLSKEPLHVSNALNQKFVDGHHFVTKLDFDFFLSPKLLVQMMCFGQCLGANDNQSFKIIGSIRRSCIPPVFASHIRHVFTFPPGFVDEWVLAGFVLVVETSCLAEQHEKHVGIAEKITGCSLAVSWLKLQKQMLLRNDTVHEYKHRKIKTKLDESTKQVIKRELGLAIEKQRQHERQTMPDKNDGFSTSPFGVHLLENYASVLSCHSKCARDLKNGLRSCVSSQKDYAAKMKEEVDNCKWPSSVTQFYAEKKRAKKLAKQATRKKLTSKQPRKAANELQPASHDQVEALRSWKDAVQCCIDELEAITTSKGEFEQIKLQNGAYFVCTLLHKYLVLNDKSPKENNAFTRNTKNFESIWEACIEHVLPTIHVPEEDANLDEKVKTAKLQLHVYLLLELYKMRSNLVSKPANEKDNKIFNHAARRLLVNLSSENFMPFLNEYLIPNYVDTAGQMLADTLEEFFLPLPEELKPFGDFDDLSSVCGSSVMGPSISSRFSHGSGAGSSGRASAGSFTKRERRPKMTRAVPLYPTTRQINLSDSDLVRQNFAENLAKKSDRLLQVAEDSPSESSRRTSSRIRGPRKDNKLAKGARRNLFSTSSSCSSSVALKPAKSPPKYKSDEDDDERKLRSRTISIQDTPNSKKSMGSALVRQRHRTRKKNCTKDEKLEDTVAESPTKEYLPCDSSRAAKFRIPAKHGFYSDGPSSQARSTQLAILTLRKRTQEQSERDRPWYSPRTRMFGWKTEAQDDSSEMHVDGMQDVSFPDMAFSPNRSTPTKKNVGDLGAESNQEHDSMFGSSLDSVSSRYDDCDAFDSDDPLRCIFESNAFEGPIQDTDMDEVLQRVIAHTYDGDRETFRREVCIPCDVEVEEDGSEGEPAMPESSKSPLLSPKKRKSNDVMPSLLSTSESPIMYPENKPWLPLPFDKKDEPITSSPSFMSPKKTDVSDNKFGHVMSPPLPPPPFFMSPKKRDASGSELPSSKGLLMSSPRKNLQGNFSYPEKMEVNNSESTLMSPPGKNLRGFIRSSEKGDVSDIKPEFMSPDTHSMPGPSFISLEKKDVIDNKSGHPKSVPPKPKQMPLIKFPFGSGKMFSKHPLKLKPKRLQFDPDEQKESSRRTIHRTVSQRYWGESSASSTKGMRSPEIHEVRTSPTKRKGLLRTASSTSNGSWAQELKQHCAKLSQPPRLQRANTRIIGGNCNGFQKYKPTEEEDSLIAGTSDDSRDAKDSSTSWFDNIEEDNEDGSCIMLLSPAKADRASRVAKVTEESDESSKHSYLPCVKRKSTMLDDSESRRGEEEKGPLRSHETSHSIFPVRNTPLSFDDSDTDDGNSSPPFQMVERRTDYSSLDYFGSQKMYF